MHGRQCRSDCRLAAIQTRGRDCTGQVLKRKGLYRNGHSDRLAKLSSYVAYEAVLEEVSGRSAVVQV